MKTNTPRTDAATALTSQHRHDDCFGDPEFGWVTVGFARTLERELARMERLRFGADADRRLLRGELEKERAVSADHIKLYQERVALADKHLTALAGEKEKVRVLRESLAEIEDHSAGWIKDTARKALEATDDTQ